MCFGGDVVCVSFFLLLSVVVVVNDLHRDKKCAVRAYMRF